MALRDHAVGEVVAKSTDADLKTVHMNVISFFVVLIVLIVIIFLFLILCFACLLTFFLLFLLVLTFLLNNLLHLPPNQLILLPRLDFLLLCFAFLTLFFILALLNNLLGLLGSELLLESHVITQSPLLCPLLHLLREHDIVLRRSIRLRKELGLRLI